MQPVTDLPPARRSPGAPAVRPASARGLAVLALCLLMGAVIALWLRSNPPPGPGALAEGRLLSGDLVNYYIPMISRAMERVAAGEVPLWNPYACSGMPFLGTLQAAVFYPGSWLALALPAYRAVPLVVFLELLLAGGFAHALFRSWGGGPFSSAAGGLLFVFACCLSEILWPTAIATILWLPWLLLCVEKLAAGGRVGWWCGLAFGIALQLFAGFPQYAIYGYQLVGLHALLRIVESGSVRSALRLAGVLSSAVFVGAGIAGVQLAPTYELMTHSTREHHLTPREVHYLNVGGHHGSPGVLRAALNPVPRDRSHEHGKAGYLGYAALLLMAIGFFDGWRRPLVWTLALVGALSLLLADGYMGPGRFLYERYASLPLLGSFRTPERLRLLTFFCATALAARGFAVLELRSRGRGWLLAVGGITATGLAVAVSLLVSALPWRVGVAALAVALPAGAPPGSARHALGCALLLSWIATELVLATPPFSPLRRIEATAVDGYRYDPPLNALIWVVPPEALPDETLEEALRVAGDGRVELPGFSPYLLAAPAPHVRRASCYEPLVPAPWRRLQRALLGRRRIRGGTLQNLHARPARVLDDLAGVRAVVRHRKGRSARVEVNRDALPRAYWIGRYAVATPEQAIAAVAKGEPALTREVWLDRDPGLAPPDAAEPGLVPASLLEDRPERVVIAVDAPRDGLVVLTDTAYPGWRAQVDGKPAEILVANGVHRAVAVHAGARRVSFEYRPASFRIGASLSLASLALVGAVAFRARRHSS